ncbi:DUF2062 domain-containing protein [Gammaproteobacteria bacterium]|nr:DUF2062 domain-containing protein [Gammaproteobacteria bacterium]
MTLLDPRIKQLKVLVVIPTYNNATTILDVISDVQQYTENILVVNDGSTDHTADLLASISQTKKFQIITISENKGKGNALKIALRQAYEWGYDYALTLDADGQHFAKDIRPLIDEIEKTPNQLLIGSRDLQADNMPSKNTFANKFSNFWYKVETGIQLNDTQSGFRLYPLAHFKHWKFISGRYEFEVEVIVKAAWKGLSVKNIPIHVYYPPEEERVSHFRPFWDFFRISVLNTLLVLIALLFYYPFKFLRALTWKNIKLFFQKNITKSPESNLRIASAIGFGVFMGIVPLWGYQILICLTVAHLLKLNKILAVAFSNISIPPMIPVILYSSYYLGCQLLNRTLNLSLESISLKTVLANFSTYLLGSVILALLAGGLAFIVSFALLALFGRKPTVEMKDVLK